MVGILQGNLAEDNTKRIKMLVPFPPTRRLLPSAFQRFASSSFFHFKKQPS
jgi:hypothetical protein